jgi:hypothetical protein
MRWMMKLYSLALLLYPRQFRTRFMLEMEEIFHDGLLEASKQGQLAGFILRELLHLPGSLFGVYVWSMRSGEANQVTVSSMVNGDTLGGNTTSEGWGASFMAGLPHLLMGIIVVSSEIIYWIKAINQNVFSYILLVCFSLLLLGVLIFNIAKGWKSWSASWIVYMYVLAILLLSLAVNTLLHSILKNNNWVNEVQVIIIPLALAYLLYKLACKDRLRGLMAAIPPMAIIWTFFLEFVPALQKSLAWIWIFLLAFTASVLMLRVKRFSTALLLAMAVPVLGGFPFAYLGVYLGGTLPFSESGPSLQEVFRQYIPFLVMVLTIVLGPQLALKLRIVGHESADVGGKTFYRLALGGILLGLLFTLFQWIISSSEVTIQLALRKGLFITSILLYLVGFGLLVWATYQSKLLSSNNRGLLKLGALFFLVPFVPIVILLAIPVPMGNYTDSWLVPLVEIVWLIATILVVKD